MTPAIAAALILASADPAAVQPPGVQCIESREIMVLVPIEAASGRYLVRFPMTFCDVWVSIEGGPHA